MYVIYFIVVLLAAAGIWYIVKRFKQDKQDPAFQRTRANKREDVK